MAYGLIDEVLEQRAATEKEKLQLLCNLTEELCILIFVESAL